MVPVVGYLPMVLAFKYSRQLLSTHFWTVCLLCSSSRGNDADLLMRTHQEQQRKQFAMEEFDERVAKFHGMPICLTVLLVRSVHVGVFAVVQKLLAHQDSTFIEKVNAAKSTTEMLQVAISNQMPYFQGKNQWSFSSISGEHLRKLSEAHALLLLPVYAIMPPGLLRHWLEQRANQVNLFVGWNI